MVSRAGVIKEKADMLRCIKTRVSAWQILHNKSSVTDGEWEMSIGSNK